MTQPTPASIRPAAAFVRIALISTATAVLLAVIGYWPTTAQAGSAGVIAMLVGIAVSLIGAWAGAAPTVAFLRKPPREHPTGILGGLGVRFAVTLGLAVALALTDAFSNVPLLLWVAISQLVILVVDVLGLTGLLKRAARDAA